MSGLLSFKTNLPSHFLFAIVFVSVFFLLPMIAKTANIGIIATLIVLAVIGIWGTNERETKPSKKNVRGVDTPRHAKLPRKFAEEK